MNRDTLINAFTGTPHYANFFASFAHRSAIKVDLKRTDVSEALYYHMCKLHYAGWQHRIAFDRGQKHGVAEIFQDLVAYYLGICLGPDYSLHLEQKQREHSIRPDILIKRKGEALCAIEVKTSIGWARPNDKDPDPIGGRLTQLSQAFQWNEDRIMFVFETYRNVTTEFTALYWDREARRPKPRPTTYPYGSVYPLFHIADPYYWKWKPGTRDRMCHPISDQEILGRTASNIVTPLEAVAERISKLP
jgi:hypothetical protein